MRTLHLIFRFLGGADPLVIVAQGLEILPRDCELLLHAADALVCLDQPAAHFGQNSSSEGPVSVGALVSSAIDINSGEEKKRRCIDTAGDTDKIPSRFKCVAINNEALLLVSQGRIPEAIELLRRGVLISPAEEQRPIFNLCLLLWRDGHREEAADLWLAWRFRNSFREESSPLEVCRCLLDEALLLRGRLLASSTPGLLLTSHVPPKTQNSISALQTCMVDVLVLEHRLARESYGPQVGGN